MTKEAKTKRIINFIENSLLRRQQSKNIKIYNSNNELPESSIEYYDILCFQIS